jgi:pYEATS domain-containing protein involved in immunity
MNTPKLKAEFLLDKAGKPVGRSSGHYQIVLSVENAPPDTHAVTYQLDPSYYDPIRTVRGSQGNFAEEITSYGNYYVQARVRARDRVIPAGANLYQALLRSHGNSNDEAIRKALADIRDGD